MLNRIDAFIALSAGTRTWPAHRATMTRLRDVLRQRWREAEHLPLYPAFAR